MTIPAVISRRTARSGAEITVTHDRADRSFNVVCSCCGYVSGCGYRTDASLWRKWRMRRWAMFSAKAHAKSVEARP